ncbi:DUF3179 domain-containing protein [Aquimarina sp. 2201CG5-10]|uniref:DUF3179 domain-containing protein n=1 Tax=Aquimarina callyspongiae TaxID=3098150 RepID=UPI002AB3B31F|nr:DUF3179 domain-containing protein [Aquimarina sp. 2201CG5-10]MDY8138210.1 DUF3179 domain-containing protein [Aquimarina sp. 2201CG5-10]
MNTFLTNLLLILSIAISSGQTIVDTDAVKPDYEYFLDLFTSQDNQTHKEALKYIDTHWKEDFEIMAVESVYLLKSPSNGLKLLTLLQKKTKKYYGYEFNRWYEYIWNKNPAYNSSYFSFKAKLHSFIDPKFEKYFINRDDQSKIRLDEVRWGGVVQDGIPPLRNPQMIHATRAEYLNDNDIVFGISINSDTRAYPKRILAWHEMFTDTVGEIPVAGVYCTLCGTVILYKTKSNGTAYQLGTSGFLYRSNKLMYDQKTQSLWNTLWGTPVLGPLADKDIQLDYLSVVTTTWGEWKKLHPKTTVLSLQTGHSRDYGEGVAYRDYFSNDDLMFSVSTKDTRLKNKQEILAIRLPAETDENIAISSKFLRKHKIHTGVINTKNFTVFTDKSGAHRVYFTKNVQFNSYDKKTLAKDENGTTWELQENILKNTITGETLKRLPTHNAFWFGYHAAFPEATLIK